MANVTNVSVMWGTAEIATIARATWDGTTLACSVTKWILKSPAELVSTHAKLTVKGKIAPVIGIKNAPPPVAPIPLHMKATRASGNVLELIAHT